MSAVWLGVGVLLGYGLAVWANERAFRLAARYHTTGTVPIPTAEEREPRITGSPEANAQREIDKDAIRRGADQIQDAYANQGLTISRKDAEAQAMELINSANPLGGAH